METAESSHYISHSLHNQSGRELAGDKRTARVEAVVLIGCEGDREDGKSATGGGKKR